MRRLNSGRITERLASRVKGLTADFCDLLLTADPDPAAQWVFGGNIAGKSAWKAADR
jgi:hypothetical protein